MLDGRAGFVDGLCDSQLSIVIPTLDSVGWLSQVLRSHRGQFPAAEIVVVDDGSRDGTADLLDRELGPELGLTVIRNPDRSGQWRSTIRGCLAASSPLVLTIDDDVVLRGPFIHAARAIEGGEADVVYLHPDRRSEPPWRLVGSAAFRQVARLRGFPSAYARATSSRVLRSECVRGAGDVPLEVHLARQELSVAVVDGAVEKLAPSVSRYSVPRLLAHGYMHLRAPVRAKAEL